MSQPCLCSIPIMWKFGCNYHRIQVLSDFLWGCTSAKNWTWGPCVCQRTPQIAPQKARTNSLWHHKSVWECDLCVLAIRSLHPGRSIWKMVMGQKTLVTPKKLVNERLFPQSQSSKETPTAQRETRVKKALFAPLSPMIWSCLGKCLNHTFAKLAGTIIFPTNQTTSVLITKA